MILSTEWFFFIGVLWGIALTALLFFGPTLDT